MSKPFFNSCSFGPFSLLLLIFIDSTQCLEPNQLAKANKRSPSDGQPCFIFEEYFLAGSTTRLMLQCVGDGCSKYPRGGTENESPEDGSVLKTVFCEHATKSCVKEMKQVGPYSEHTVLASPKRFKASLFRIFFEKC